MRIGEITVGDRVLIIAEVGSNHNGDFSTAQALVDAAAKAGADAVKFQVYHSAQVVQKDVPPLAHVRGRYRTQRERFRSLEFTPSQWERLAADAAAAGILFFASVFDEASADQLDPLVPVFKIASGDLTHLPLLRYVAKKGKPVILSTGMADEEEIAQAVTVCPREQLILLHCVSCYPAAMPDVNLRAIPFLAERFGVPVGYSDHTIGITACLAAVALGAVVIEKHFTFDASQPIGDHTLSADPIQLQQLVAGIRQVEQALGRYGKRCTPAERDMRTSMRRSVYTKRALPSGSVLSERDLVCLRPATGLAPGALDRVIGRRLAQAVEEEVLLQERMLA